MSIANLFAPNDYDLFAKTITTSGGAPVNTNNIDTINLGDSLSIGQIKAAAINIGNNANMTTVNGVLNAGVIRSLDIGSITFGPILRIGANTLGLNLNPDSGDIQIDQAIGASDIYIGPGLANNVNIGRAGGAVSIRGPLTMPGLGVISLYAVMPTINGTGGGCIPATPNFVRFDATRTNNQTTINWKFTGVNTLCTANSILTIAEVLPPQFRPAIGGSADCPVIANIGVTPRTFPGLIDITLGGVISFLLQDGTHPVGVGGGATWTAATDQCALRSGSLTFDNL